MISLSKRPNCSVLIVFDGIGIATAESFMFEWLSRFDTILVTGPQRSGTRICAKMIAQDTHHEFVDEHVFGVDSLYGLYDLMDSKRQTVIQCPVLCRYVHMFKEHDTAVVLMRRKVEDIIASQQRIHWKKDWLELMRYDRSVGVISEIKYQFWDQFQKRQIKNAFEVEYDSLRAHPLWLPQELRRDFSATQTTYSVRNVVVGQNSRPAPNINVQSIDKFDQDSVAIVKNAENIRMLNSVGKFIWNLCDESHTYAEIFRALQTEFSDVDENLLSSDLEHFISDLVVNGFLRINTSDDVSNNIGNG